MTEKTARLHAELQARAEARAETGRPDALGKRARKEEILAETVEDMAQKGRALIAQKVREGVRFGS